MTETIRDLLIDEMQDLYDAEKQLVKALPKMVKAASSEELSQAFAGHLEQTKGHVQRLERPPPGPRDALLPALQALADLGRDGDGGEQADHDLSTLATTGARRPTITFTPLALGWMPSPWFRPWVSSTPPRRFG